MMARFGLTLVVVFSACNRHDSNGHAASGNSDIDRALALRGGVPDAEARWPAGTVWLVPDQSVKLAASHGADLIVATDGGTILRVPKDGGAPVRLAEFAGQEIFYLVVAGAHAVVAVYVRTVKDEGDELDGRIIAVPLAGGPQLTIRPHVDTGIDLVGVADGVYVASGRIPTRVAFYAAPRFDRGEPLLDRALPNDGMVVESDATIEWAEWPDDTYGPRHIYAWKRGDNAPRLLASANVMGLVTDGKRLYFVRGDLKSATAPGGGEYFEDDGSLVALDRVSGAMTPLFTGRNLDPPKLGSAALCVIVGGPKLEFNKNTTVVVVPTSGGSEHRLASGIAHAVCAAVDERAVYVTTSARKGIAKLPIGSW